MMQRTSYKPQPYALARSSTIGYNETRHDKFLIKVYQDYYKKLGDIYSMLRVL